MCDGRVVTNRGRSLSGSRLTMRVLIIGLFATALVTAVLALSMRNL